MGVWKIRNPETGKGTGIGKRTGTGTGIGHKITIENRHELDREVVYLD